MDIALVITGLFLFFSAIFAYVKSVSGKRLPEPPAGSNYRVETVERTGDGLPDSADVYLYVDGRYHSMAYVWKKKKGMYKYGGSLPWAGYAATKEAAIEICSIRLVMDAGLEKI